MLFYIVSHLIHNFFYGSFCIIGLLLFKKILLKNYGGKTYLSLWLLPLFSFINPLSFEIGFRNTYFIQSTLLRNTVPLYRTQIITVCCILFVVSVILSIRYLREKIITKQRLHSIASAAPAAIIELLEQEKGKLKIKNNVKVMINQGINTPFAIYIENPIIMLPEYSFSEAELSLVVRHELCHLKYKHTFYKELATFVHMLFWWNPLTYNLLQYVASATEYACDQMVMETCSAEKRRIYADILYNMVEYTSKKQHYLAYFSDSPILSRIQVMTIKKYKSRFLPILISVLLVLGNLFSFKSDSEVGMSADFSTYTHGDYEIIEQFGGMYDIYLDGELVAHGVEEQFITDLTRGEE